MNAGGLTDEELLERLATTGSKVFVAQMEKELMYARETMAAGLTDVSFVRKIHERFTCRMHDLSEFMKSLLQRFARWFNAKQQRSEMLWEERYKSVIVEDGLATKTMVACIDLNPMRARIVKVPEDYRCSSYGEAIGGGAKGNGKKARTGVV